ncbi:helicase domino isoform X8 [Monomorium pharaonis]|uniref:helicase domino isoform X8 n=1 Tax=Monomorium pharaonis TaxID=307658 RepID=UPI00063F5A7B|nr:helicase domino isoform X8 [Monomorium pharaonis]
MSDKQGAPILPPLNRGAANNGGNNGSSAQQTVSLQQVLTTPQGLNVLATTSGQQFVITTQIPGLQVIQPNNATTNASGTQQVGVTRFVNITPPRNAVGNVSIAGTSPHSSPVSRPQNSPKVMLTTSPKLVRTSISNIFVAPMSSSSPSQVSSPQVQVQSPSPPARKRLKLSETTEKSIPFDATGYRRRIMEHKMRRMRSVREKYTENASELFFLHAGGNIMDYYTWRKRSPTPQFVHFLRQHRLDPDDENEDLTTPLSSIPEFSQLPAVTTTITTTTTVTSAIVTATTAVTTVTSSGSTVVQIPSQRAEVKIAGAGSTPVAVSTTLPAAALAQLTQGQVPGRPQGGRHGMVFAFRAAIQSSPVTVHPPSASTVTPTFIIGGTSVDSKATTTTNSPVVEKSSITTVATPRTSITSVSLNNPQPIVKLVKLSTPTTITTSCDITNNQEQIVEKAKQEAYVMQRIAELQREGLWSERRLPKVQEPTRTKAHWDYLLEEMVWLAADFAQERKWKKAAAKKCARMVQKYFQEKAIQAQKAEKSQELRLKKIASLVAKEIKTFWANVEKLVEYKQHTRLEEKRKKALDQHLNFIVGQTEKYSTWLTEGLNKTDGPQSIPASINSSRISSPVPLGKCHSDEEFQPNQSSDDDEETIAKAEEEMKATNHKEEVELLKRESEIPLEDLLKDLPPDYLENRNRSLSPQTATNEEHENEEAVDADTDFIAASGESSDEEDTIMEEERLEGEIDHKRELDELKADNEMSIDELAAKYANMSDMLMNVEETEGTDKESSDKEAVAEIEDQITSSESESEESDHDSDEEETRTQSDTETDVGLQSLLEDPSAEKQSDNRVAEDDHSDAHNEMDNVAALAESIQPKGNTLLTTSVVTKIPFLLKHSLREYQHIGLDWLVTMYDRKLNGILADEMGLGKTIQTIALLAHLACEKGNWGPHLIIVPTSVMLNWEMECKKWCPGFKILTYYGTQKERKQKRTGWTKPNAFHICITSYKLVIQDHQSFRRKKWKYLILDEAQNIKNFKSQRWQLLLNFQTQRRLLLTGTPLQNNLMELWSLMHFLMPNVFQSHREFKEWFSNPVTGMIEGNSEYNENIIRRLHKVLRPFLLRRLKTEVEKQLPKKYEHVVMCRLSKRQRFLYDDFMSRAKTKETLASGNLLSVINVLMQLRKVCNHPNLFEVRPTVSPFQMEAIEFVTASLVWNALDYDPFKHIQLSSLNLLLLDLEVTLTAFVAHRINRLRTPRKLIEEIDSQPEPAPRCPSGRIKINVRLSNQAKPQQQQQQQAQTRIKHLAGVLPTPRVGTSPLIKSLNTSQSGPGQVSGVTLRVASGQQLQGYSLQLVPHQGSVKAIPVATLGHNPQSTTVTSTTASTNAQRITVGNANIRDGIQRLATQTVTVKQGDSVQRIAVPGFAQLVQTSTGRHFILTPSQQNTNTVSFPVMTSSTPRFTVLSKSLMGLSTSGATTVNKVVSGVVTTPSGRPVMRVPPLNVTASQSPSGNNGQQIVSQQQPQSIRSIVTRQAQKEVAKAQNKEEPKSEFYLPQLEEERRQRRQTKLHLLANVNERRCAACPLYGEDLFMALRIGKPTTACRWHNGWVHCTTSKENIHTRKEFFSRTEALAEAIKSTEQIVEEFKEVFERFVIYVPAVRAPVPRFHVSHPSPHKLWNARRLWTDLQQQLSPKLSLFHPISSLMLTQFPDPRLIQYDCGKLQSLDHLLRKLKSENHRVLIFTQMTRMLDVLEAFLNFHGHIYLRLDGTTRVDQRQVLMERFNGDKRIFCFILSTRSGGVGVNLTGADTVIFYDSDWNPTMDAQAQDRCHRIGQTRDVHIYRLVSEKTVEENILKKANQKRLLGDLAIEGGNFTTAYFKSSTIQDLFNIDQTENDASTRMAEVLEQNRDREKAWNKDVTAGTFQGVLSGQHTEEKTAMGALESALAAVEEDLDVQAAKTAKAEAVADLAEFDENIPLEEADKDDTQVSKAEQDVQNLISQLTPIERYAMKFVEESEGAFSAAQLAAAERELEEQKKEWELDRLRALREEEERRMRLADDDEKPLTFGREDAQNQIWLSKHTMEQMPMWCPPTPPTTDNDVYIDYSLGFLYENVPMTEAQLPPIYVKKERIRSRIEIGITDDGCRPAKIMRHKEESVYAPRSLFDRPSPALMKMRRDMKLYKYRAIVRPPIPVLKTSSHVTKTSPEPDQAINWLVYEEWSLLHSIQNYQSLPLNTMILSPGHTPNWDMVADVLNNSSRLFRSPKECRGRYDSVIVPREEGKLIYDTTPKKQKKQKGNVYKALPVSEQQSKSNRSMRTSQLHNQDKNSSFSSTGGQRYEIMKSVSNKRTPTVKPTSSVNQMRNPTNTAVLAEYKVQSDNSVTPTEVAMRRADRIAKEKLNKASQVLTPEQQQQVAARLLQHQQQAAQQQQQLKLQQQQTQQQAGQQAIANSVASQIHQLTQAIPSVTSAKAAATSVSLSNVATTTATATTVVKARPGGGQMAIQDVRTTSANAMQTVQRIATASLVSASQTSAGAVGGQKGSLVGVTMTTAVSGSKTPTAAQVQYYRQQQQQVLLRQQQLKVLQAQAAGGQKVSVAVSATAAAAAAAQVQQRAAAATLMKQGIAAVGTAGTVTTQAAVSKPTMTRTMSDTEMAALLKRQVQQQAKAAAAAAVAQVQVPAGQTGITPAAAQLFAQAGLQMQQTGTSAGAPVATLVKTANVAGVRTATPQQIRQLALHPHLLSQRKLPQKVAQLTQVANKGGVQTQLIVQPTKSLPTTMTVQQIQQVMKHVQPSTMQQFSHGSTGQSVSQASQVVLAKSPQLQTRVIPVASTGLKQTIQVVTASNSQLRQSTPIQGKPVVGAVRRSPGPNPGSGTSPSAAASGSTVATGTSPGVGASASTSNLASSSVLGHVRLQTLTQQQQTQQQQQQTQQDAQPK